MPQYMLSVHTSAAERLEPMTDEQIRDGYAKVAGLESQMEADDAFLYSARLGPADEAKVIRRGPGRPKATDGPYVETKEHLGGFYLIEAAGDDAALDWATRVSDAIGEPIEVRRLAGSRSR